MATRTGRRGGGRYHGRAAGGALLAIVAVLVAAAGGRAQQPPFVERVEVTRVLIDARVFDDAGQPLAGLGPADFAVRIGGRRARVESAEWVGSAAGDAAGDAGRAAEATAAREGPAPHGRLVVFLVQRDLEPRRMTGLMQMGQLVDTLLQTLTSDDRMAVLSFDSRLRAWTDFTGDLARIRSLLAQDVISGRPGPLAEADDVSLLARLAPARAAKIYRIEHAMQSIAEALEPLPGAKSLILVGHGFGRFDASTGGVILMDGFDEASLALQRARVAVFTLNVTQAHFNSLQQGLQAVSVRTGGTYASTYEFPIAALERVTRALAGHYVLFVETPDLGPGAHRIEVRLTGRRGHVVARSTYVPDEPIGFPLQSPG
jgi:VWFA-related protein